MSFITYSSNKKTIKLHYQDNGIGQPIVLIHGWPLSERSWEMQEAILIEHGYRVIKYDRRGFGNSCKPIDGYDYNTLTQDLNEILTQLDLKKAVLVGFSMGAGEVARYIGDYGTSRLDKAIFISGITPFLLKTDNNPAGVPKNIFEDMKKAIKQDRPLFLQSFLNDFFNQGLMGLKDVSPAVIKFNWNIACLSSPIATVKCIDAWLEDFRDNLEKCDIPVLVIHGDSDKIVPYNSSGLRMKNYVNNCTTVTISGGPHGILISHALEVNEALVSFLNRK